MDEPTITIEQATTEATSWVDNVVDYLPLILFALLAVVLAVLIARLTRKWLNRLTRQRIENRTIAELVASGVAIIIVVIGVVVALQILQLDDAVTSVLAGAGIIGLAIGFALQDVASNFLSGIIIATQKQFSVGDLIETQEVFGTVKDIELRMTAVQTLTGQIVYIPNKDILLNVLTDYSNSGRRRIDLSIGVSYDDDLQLAEETALKVVGEIDHVLSEPAPSLFYTEFGDSSINFEVRFWIHSGNSQGKYLTTRSTAIKNIKHAFDEAGVTIPFPITTVHMDQQE